VERGQLNGFILNVINLMKICQRQFMKTRVVISTNERNLQGCRKYPHQPRFHASLGMTSDVISGSQVLRWNQELVKLMTLALLS
jgi:hypothetical protein